MIDSKHIYNLILIILLSLTTQLSASNESENLFDQSLEDLMAMESELKAEVGSRVGARNFLNSRTPVDVITHQEIAKTGLTSLAQVIRYFVPGFNLPEPAIADGTDHVRVISFRGMSPDQILVLLNGKRLHVSSLLHSNSTIGRGSSGVDLDTINLESIEKIEILRDGAAAQYGSDAISGVINIILKGISDDHTVKTHAGIHSKGDGETFKTSIFTNYPLKYDGFANLSLSVQKEERTQRAGLDKRLTPKRVESYYGQPNTKSLETMLNIEAPTGNDLIFYSHGLSNFRQSQSSAFFRPPSTDSSPLYPNGFLPLIEADIFDFSLTGGVTGILSNGVEWDISNTYGKNIIKLSVDNSMNYSLGASSPSSFENGNFTFSQNTLHFDLKKGFKKLDLAGGLEYRYEQYEIEAGDFASYTGNGSQGFSGYRPSNEVDEDRNSYALYTNNTYQFTSDFAVEAAYRYEKFTDFGSTSNFKIASDYRILEKLLLRASSSTGFRAPSLSQSYFSQISSFADTSGNLVDQGTFRPNHEVSQAFGGSSLKAETSTHFTFGGVFEFNRNFTFMADYFYVNVKDRIMLSDERSGSTPEQLAILDKYNISNVRFLTNAVDTETHGIDLRLNYKHVFKNQKSIEFGIWQHFNQNRVVGFNQSSVSPENSFEQIDRLERGLPQSSTKFLFHFKIQKLDYTLNLSRYGNYQQVRDNVAYNFDPQWTLDTDLAYNWSQQFTIAVGANNLLNSYPDKWSSTLTGDLYAHDGIIPYSRYAPNGVNGAYYYVRAIYSF